MTLVVNMLGGSGIGKSTTAAGLYYHMKLNHMNVELVREYVKVLAWQGASIGRFDQVNIFGEQCKLEHTLYGKVDYIVTDSPIILAPIYEFFYHGDSMMEEAALKFLKKSKEINVRHLNVVLERNKSYDPRGRFQTEEEAKTVDSMTLDFLKKYNIDYCVVSGSEESRVKQIMELIQNEQEKDRSMDSRCPRKLEHLPCDFCPLAVLRLKALRNSDQELSEDEESTLPGCSWAINHQMSNYCFFNYVADYLHDVPSDKEIAHMNNVSVETIKDATKDAIEEIKCLKVIKDLDDDATF